MGFWNTAKWTLTTALDHIEGRPTRKQYKLHPDSAYLGNKYYAKETPVPPNFTRPRTSGNPTSTSTSTSSTLPSLASSPQSLTGGDTEGMHIGLMQPHVHIGKKAVQTPMRLPEAKYTVLRQGDLVDDDKIDSTVGRDRDLYWVVKGAVVLMVKERSEAVTTPARKTREEGREEVMEEAVDGVNGGHKNLLRSPSVEGMLLFYSISAYVDIIANQSPDFFADIFDEGQYAPIDTLPPNPLAKVPGISQSLNPLDAIPWSELIIVFRRDTKELFVRKQDGKLYPVVWKVRAMHSRLQEVYAGSRAVNGVKFTSVEGEIDAEGYVNVEFV
ncbi:hypothetical protein P171DRAFT_38111 [Karstenula rhodostoma CBS 690.94]|uniref:Uncharacterized protein n=1 Tax=Karstenula rhodostoma CBS 690.94 TaxID=1392251 RepID=A0A9P4UBU2_9PLEO|nr:hypothetical protein P171DRAFT_38111 [Karstenula rhodostoma CBS 690.94]